MNDKFDLQKAMANGGKCRTRDGRPARIICTDAKVSHFSIIGLVKNGDFEEPCYFFENGHMRAFSESECDLLNIPERIKRDVWVNVYKDCIPSVVHTSKEKADDCSGTDRLACVHITIDCEEGEGLDSYGKVG